jgi:hypothetical protein
MSFSPARLATDPGAVARCPCSRVAATSLAICLQRTPAARELTGGAPSRRSPRCSSLDGAPSSLTTTNMEEQ